MKEIKTFLGTGWSFPPKFEIGAKSVQMVSDAEDVKQSLILLMSTSPGERLTNPEYGCDLHSTMFKNQDTATLSLMHDIISTAVLRYESRVTLDDIDFDIVKGVEGKINIKLHYTIRTVNVRDNVVYPYYFVEGTNVVEV